MGTSVLIVLLGVTIGFGVNLWAHRVAQTSDTWSVGAWRAIGVLVVVGAVVMGVLEYRSSTPPEGPSTTSPTPPTGAAQPSSDPAGPPRTRRAETSTPSAPPDPDPVLATSLLDLPAVTQDVGDDIDLSDPGTVQINGKTYGQALAYECSIYCDGSSPQVREVVLGGQFTSFTAQAAVLDTSAGTHRIDITLDSGRPRTFTIRPGRTVRIKLDVAGVARMRVQLYAPGEIKSPLQAGVDLTAGENGGGLPGIALGDPLLLP